MEAEEKVREMLRSGESTQKVAKELGVHRVTIGKIRNVLTHVETNPEWFGPDSRNYRFIVALLNAGVSNRQIADRLHLDEEYVTAVRRHTYMNKREAVSDHECPSCGSMVLVQPTEEVENRSIHVYDGIFDANGRDMLSILLDLDSLGRLNIITNPLFYQLAKRACELLDKIEEE